MRNFVALAVFTILSRNEYLQNIIQLFKIRHSQCCLTFNLYCIGDIQKPPRSSLASHGSCRAAKKCCDGKDTDCEVKLDPSETNIILNFSGESCYCDHGCLDMGDCCHDFKDYCGGICCHLFNCQAGTKLVKVGLCLVEVSWWSINNQNLSKS